MNFVQPIREEHIVRDMADYLKKNNYRNYILFLCGIYTGLRISDILKLKVEDVKNKNYINMREMKTGKQKTIEINPILKKELQEYCKDKDYDDYLIKSRQNYNTPISRSMAYKIIRETGEKLLGTIFISRQKM